MGFRVGRYYYYCVEPLVLQFLNHTLDSYISTETHPRPPKPDPVKSSSSVLSSLTPAKSAPVINNGSPTILGKRSYEQHNGVDGESEPQGWPCEEVKPGLLGAAGLAL